ncbi:hypothetical protein Tco_0506318 [Tanacetum coccineum]
MSYRVWMCLLLKLNLEAVSSSTLLETQLADNATFSALVPDYCCDSFVSLESNLQVYHQRNSVITSLLFFGSTILTVERETYTISGSAGKLSSCLKLCAWLVSTNLFYMDDPGPSEQHLVFGGTGQSLFHNMTPFVLEERGLRRHFQ